MTSEKKSIGKPLKFSSPERLQSVIDTYFQYCDDNKKPYTMAGLAYYLDVDTKTLSNYAHRDTYLPAIKKARQRVEMRWAERLDDPNCTGAIFCLKVNFKYSEHKEQGDAGADIGASLATLISSLHKRDSDADSNT